MKRVQIDTDVTLEFLADAEADLIEAMRERLLAYRDRLMPPGVRVILFRLIAFLSLFGLALLGLLFILDRRLFSQSPLLPESAVFFLMLFAFSVYQKRQTETARGPFYGYWSWLAKNRAKAMLSRARKLAPFVASYDFRGDSVTYHRTRQNRSRFIWARQFKGFRLTRKNYTVLFKRRTSPYPYAIVLHNPSKDFEAYLDELGILSLQEEVETDAPDKL